MLVYCKVGFGCVPNLVGHPSVACEAEINVSTQRSTVA